MLLIRLPQRFFLTLLAVPIFCSTPDTAVAQDGLFDIADLVNDALRAINEPEAEEVEGIAVFEEFGMEMAANGDVPVAASTLKPQKERLEAYTLCVHGWIVRTLELDETEAATVKAAFDQRLETALAAKSNPIQNNLPRHLALKFTEPGALAARIDAAVSIKGVNDLPLSEEQKAKLLDALKKRQQSISEANLGQAVNLIDSEFFLSDDQRAAISEQIRQQLDVMRPSFSLSPQTYYFPQQSLIPIVGHQKITPLWSPAQNARADSIRTLSGNGGNSERYIMFQMSTGDDSWEDELTEHMESQTQRMTTALEVQIDYYRRIESLSEQDTFYLQVAGKGAVDAVLTGWKKTTKQQLDRNREAFAGQMGNFAFSIEAPSLNTTRENEIWKTTVQDLTPNHEKVLGTRTESIQDATARYIVGMLDRELWLTDEQRQQLLKAVRKGVPKETQGLMNQEYFRALSYLCLPMFKLSNHDLKDLTPAQKAAYDLLKKPFSLNGQYVQFQSQHGQMMFELPGARRGQGAAGVGFF